MLLCFLEDRSVYSTNKSTAEEHATSLKYLQEIILDSLQRKLSKVKTKGLKLRAFIIYKIRTIENNEYHFNFQQRTKWPKELLDSWLNINNGEDAGVCYNGTSCGSSINTEGNKQNLNRFPEGKVMSRKLIDIFVEVRKMLQKENAK